ncbi:hypothetical protein CsSME_00018340 [Camellia sinensis var. sinensis]
MSMISSLKQSTLPITGSEIFRRETAAPTRHFSVLLPLPTAKSRRTVSIAKPLFVSSIEGFGSLKSSSLITCKAYEADRSQPIKQSEGPSEAAMRVKIGIYFAIGGL